MTWITAVSATNGKPHSQSARQVAGITVKTLKAAILIEMTKADYSVRAHAAN
jgi:hypothetical protein